MKIILSRKGFDSSYGGIPSPILPDGSLISLPIPVKSSSSENPITYSDLRINEKENYGQLLEQLGANSHLSKFCHLDPDIYKQVYTRNENWRGLFGQAGAAGMHLDNHEVNKDDIFLFFGWFQNTTLTEGKYKYQQEASKHLLFGYLQIDEVIYIDHFTKYPGWMSYHPHFDYNHRFTKGNRVYLAKEKLSLDENLPGFGIFRFSKELVLTKDGCTRTKWDLPECFRNVEISYHTTNSWKEDYFQSVARGQEFVIHCNDSVINWAYNLIKNNLT